MKDQTLLLRFVILDIRHILFSDWEQFALAGLGRPGIVLQVQTFLSLLTKQPHECPYLTCVV